MEIFYAAPEEKQLFLDHYKITEEQLKTFIVPGFDNTDMKRSITDLIEEYFPIILESWRKIAPPPVLLKHNNDPYGGGHHISPDIVNITSTITVNIVCDVVDGSYQVDLSKSSQAQQDYILHAFTPQASPRWLIVS